MKRRKYEMPQTLRTEIELEQGILMSASVFEPGKDSETGVSISGHEIGNSVDYSDPTNPNGGWDTDDVFSN